MWKVVCPIVLSAGLLGCTPRDALPVLSLRGMTVLHDRPSAATLVPHGQRVDYALSLQLAFNPGVRDRRQRDLGLERDVHFSAEPITCSDPVLCSWADAAEQAALAALGVLP
jgi:hypothetical protein